VKIRILSAVFVAAALAPQVYASEASSELRGSSLDSAEAMVLKTDKDSALIQQKINSLDDTTRDRLERTRQILARAEQLALYNSQMENIIASQEQEKQSLDQQIEDINETEQGILPLMKLMLDQLATDIESGAPFLTKERAVRLTKLNAILGRSDVTVSEKFRRVMEALQIEVEYGRTIERYREKDGDTAYDYLRVGNMALYRRALDGKNAAVWLDDGWHDLTGEEASLSKAFRVADQSVAPQLITIPLPPPQSNNSEQVVKEGDQ